jgi:hypothetical protein
VPRFLILKMTLREIFRPLLNAAATRKSFLNSNLVVGVEVNRRHNFGEVKKSWVGARPLSCVMNT